MSETLTRPAIRWDLNALVGMRRRLYVHDNQYLGNVDTRWPISDGGMADMRNHITSPDKLCLVVAEEEVVVGYLLSTLKPRSAMRGMRAELEEMYVVPERRCRGLGSALLNGFNEWCQANQVSTVLVEAFAGNTDAQAFYAARGYLPHTVRLHLELGPVS